MTLDEWYDDDSECYPAIVGFNPFDDSWVHQQVATVSQPKSTPTRRKKKMATVKLERQSISKVLSLSESEAKMLAEVRKVLGYGEGEKEVAYRNILQVLKRLNIEPLNAEKVAAYKKSKESTRYTGPLMHKIRHTARWRMIRLRDYERAVPTFVLARALQVQKALNARHLPGTMEVEELQRHKQYLDPFLVLHVEDKKLYLDVWDEPKFEGRRTV